MTVLTVKQEVTSILRMAVANYGRTADVVLDVLDDPDVEQFHAEVQAELDKIVEAYVNPPEVDEIRVGDTVRILPRYAQSIKLSDGSKNQPGAEFVVTEVNRSVYYHSGGEVSNFYVGGDPQGWGIWEQYIEKVHK